MSVKLSSLNHPIQPLGLDDHETLRFKENKIVSHLLNVGKQHGCGLNELAVMDFSVNDREQFAQLIGYSLSGFSELSYVTDETHGAAHLLAKQRALTPDQARIKQLEKTLEQVRKGLRAAATAAFRIHPADLHT